VSCLPYCAVYVVFLKERSERSRARKDWIVSDTADVLEHVMPSVPILPSNFDQSLYQIVFQNVSLHQLVHLGFTSSVPIGDLVSPSHAGLFRWGLPSLCWGRPHGEEVLEYNRARGQFKPKDPTTLLWRLSPRVSRESAACSGPAGERVARTLPSRLRATSIPRVSVSQTPVCATCSRGQRDAIQKTKLGGSSQHRR
jgi:hypothetical protein